ncbi:MAG: molybdopterin-dependent oxidoreductase [Gordonibacter sp.]
MSGTTSPQSGLTRRNFLKTTGVVAGSAAIVGGATPLTALAEDLNTGQTEAEGEQIFRGVCRPNCFSFCHLNVHVRDGKITKTSRAEYNEGCYDRICQRGLSHVHRIYDPERLQYPLRRAEGTERGAGKWERVSWDEALTEIADKIKTIQSEYGKSSVAFLTASGNQASGITGAYGRLQTLLNASSVGPCLDMGSYYGMQAVAGLYVSPMMGMQMWEGNEPTDAKNAKTIVVWGANITDAQVQNWHLVKEAMYGGTKLVVVDPVFTQIASKADKWIPIRPGSDTLLKYAIMNIVLEKEAQDINYLQQHTVAPFLVRSDTGMFVRRSNTGIAPTPTGKMNPKTGKEIIYDPYMVLSEGNLTAVSEASTPDIKGVYNLDGVPCRTAYELLEEEILSHSPEEVSKLTEVSIEDIYELADACMDTPVFHYEGYGPQAYNNGAHTTMAGLTLCALLGNLGKPGASYGAFWGIHIGGNSAYTAPNGPSAGFSIPSVDLKNVVEMKQFAGKKAEIKMLWMYSANPLNTHTDTHAWTDVIIPSMEYIVVADSAMTDSARYADMVLPIAQWFELEEVANAGQCSSLHHNEKAIEPLYESKPDTLIITELAEKLGLGTYFTLSNEEILEEAYNTDLAKAAGLSMDKLRKEKQIRFIPGNAETDPHIAYKDGAFGTASGRFEFYREMPTVRAATTKTPTPEEIDRDRMAHWFPPLEAWPENELYSKYPLVLMSERPRYRVHSQWFNTPLLRELDPEPFVKINPADAEARGIVDGSYVECFNDRGAAVAKAVFSEAIRPGALLYPKGWQLNQHKAGGWSLLSSTEFDVFAVNNNFMDVLCEVRTWKGDDE